MSKYPPRSRCGAASRSAARPRAPRSTGPSGWLPLVTRFARAQIEHARQAARIGTVGKDLVLLDLLRAGRRQRVGEVDPARCLVIGKLCIAVNEKRLGRCVARAVLM